MRRAIFMILFFAFIVLTLQSCYTLVARRSFNVRRWIREHEYQYIDNRVIRDWNQYYWRPSSQFKKRLRGGEETVKEEEEFETPEKGSIVKRRRAEESHCCCLESNFIDLIINIFIPSDNDHETEPTDTTAPPPNKRGL